MYFYIVYGTGHHFFLTLTALKSVFITDPDPLPWRRDINYDIKLISEDSPSAPEAQYSWRNKNSSNFPTPATKAQPFHRASPGFIQNQKNSPLSCIWIRAVNHNNLTWGFYVAQDDTWTTNSGATRVRKQQNTFWVLAWVKKTPSPFSKVMR